MDITVYTFESADGTEDTYTTMDTQEAGDRARQYGMRAIANTYEWADSEPLVDYTTG